jgi:hypothetical protein
VIREGECPWCRLVRDEPRRPERLVWQDDDTVAFAPFASRSPFEVWVVPAPPRGGLRAGRRRRRRADREALRQVLGRLATASTGRRTTSSSTRRRSASRSTRRTTGTGRSTPAARDRRPRARDRPAGQPGLARRTRWRSCWRGSGHRSGGRGGHRLMIGAPKAGRRQSRRHTRSDASSLAPRERAPNRPAPSCSRSRRSNARRAQR